jgi:hypothetical protein
MPGIPRDVAEHSLDIRAGARPVKQPLRRFDEEKRRAIGEEIHKLMVAGFIKEVFHLEWLANPVLVKNKGGKWRMCVDYTGLNKACPKVPYPLPRIDQIVDSTAGCETLSFLDAYSGYHQIKMKESCRRFEPGGVPGPMSKLSPRAPAQMGRRETDCEGGERSRRETGIKGETRGLRVCPAPRSGVLAVGGYKRPRGREREAYARRPVLPRAANPL